MRGLVKIFEFALFFLFLIMIFFLTNPLSTLIVIPVFLLIYLFINKCSIKNYTVFLFVIAFLERIITALLLKVDIVDDFSLMLKASQHLIQGDLSFLNLFYFKAFSYQLGHVLYQAALLKLFNSVFFLKIINSLITSLIAVFIYLISKKLFEEKTARIVSFSYLFYLYPIYLNTVLTNQHLPALLILIVIYLLITKKASTKLSILVAIILAIANIFRTESIIFILAISIYNLLHLTKNNYKTILKNTFIILITYFLFNTLTSEVLYLTPIHTKLKNNLPSWKFYCGLSYKNNGIYNIEDQSKYFSTKNKNKLLQKRISKEKYKLPILFLKKEVILWTQTNYDLAIKNTKDIPFYNFFLIFNQGYLNLILILFIISLYPSKTKTNQYILLIKIILALYYCVYMLIEISPRYAYILHILMFLIIGISLEKQKLFHIIKKIRKEGN